MTEVINLREIILGILMEVMEEEEQSHQVLRRVLEKYQFLDKRDRAFISRVSEGTLENLILIDYIIGQFSSVAVADMKPLIRNLLRLSVYQLKFMDSVPDSAVCNESVKLAQKKGFYNLKGFVNGVLRSIARNLDKVVYPDRETMPVAHLSVLYSMPEWIVKDWMNLYGFDTVEKICQAFQEPSRTYVRCNFSKASKEQIIESLAAQNILAEPSPYLDCALELKGVNYLQAVEAFKKGWIQVQDISSMLVGEAANPAWSDYCIDVCAAPGGKALHLADKLKGSGYVEARDLTDQKADRIQENIERAGMINIQAIAADATIFYPASVEKADVLLADVPCSGLGVIGRKQDIKYKMTPAKQAEIVKLQRKILDTVFQYVKVGGTLIYSTCTIGAEENQYNLKWFLDNYPFRLESLDPYLPQAWRSKTTQAGYLQLLPGVHKADGFFLARLTRIG
ncbi:MAG TPA: 16S rRNA (cytosine(967)-C(5))-methyltransferase RsmB [Candidatus Limivivens intestinipullorum]|uniref:16S rRNA (cytosine(967)-C(5))-methyltransferase n=1 Tax=Candidatus Limivivens intestinipullorum TaxID=2840858 RepID=A0A9D1EQC3_9FIRM|nr:16S rRNA (cytosine(967)-C(5))-methyltransferase RsmB [Candidatus Limivivens intestinipullorum]